MNKISISRLNPTKRLFICMDCYIILTPKINKQITCSCEKPKSIYFDNQWVNISENITIYTNVDDKKYEVDIWHYLIEYFEYFEHAGNVLERWKKINEVIFLKYPKFTTNIDLTLYLSKKSTFLYKTSKQDTNNYEYFVFVYRLGKIIITISEVETTSITKYDVKFHLNE